MITLLLPDVLIVGPSADTTIDPVAEFITGAAYLVNTLVNGPAD